VWPTLGSRTAKEQNSTRTVQPPGDCLYNIPRFFERVVVLRPSCSDGGEPKPGTSWTSLRNNRVYFLVYKTVCYFIFRSVGPLVALVALNSRLAVELRNVDRRRTALRGKTAAATTWKTGKPGDGNGRLICCCRLEPRNTI